MYEFSLYDTQHVGSPEVAVIYVSKHISSDDCLAGYIQRPNSYGFILLLGVFFFFVGGGGGVAQHPKTFWY